MWFFNKETGIQWEITDLELIDRLRANDQYEVVKEIKKVEEVKGGKSQSKE